VLLLVAVFVGVVTVPLTGGRLAALGQAKFRLVPLIFAALALQVVILAVMPAGSPLLHRLLHLASYGLAAAFLVVNRRIVGMPLVALGTALNLAAIVANGGVMPASRQAMRTADLSLRAGFANSTAVAHPKLQPLGDILAVPKGWPLANVYSIGDICIAVGVVVMMHALSRQHHSEAATVA
jgi:hypothetical protein